MVIKFVLSSEYKNANIWSDIGVAKKYKDHFYRIAFNPPIYRGPIQPFFGGLYGYIEVR